MKSEEVSFAATQHDVARLAGVSQSVVSRALSGGHVSPRTKARVLDACQTLGYVPDVGARTLVTGASNMVAVVVANIINPFYPYIFDRLTVRIQSAGQEVLLLNCPGGRDVDEMLPTVLQDKVRGVIILDRVFVIQNGKDAGGLQGSNRHAQPILDDGAGALSNL